MCVLILLLFSVLKLFVWCQEGYFSRKKPVCMWLIDQGLYWEICIDLEISGKVVWLNVSQK